MRKGNLVRIKPTAYDMAGRRIREDGSEERYSRVSEWDTQGVLYGKWPKLESERREDRGIAKRVPLTASMYLLEAARVCARDLSFNYEYQSMAVIRDLSTGQLCYVEREMLEPINTKKRFKLRECVVRKQWLLEKAK